MERPRTISAKPGSGKALSLIADSLWISPVITTGAFAETSLEHPPTDTCTVYTPSSEVEVVEVALAINVPFLNH